MKRLLILVLLFGISCSKDSDDGNTTDAVTVSLPKIISLSYNTGESVQYNFVYNSEQQIEQIIMERNSGMDITRIEFDFNYREDGLLNQVSAQNTEENTSYHTAFTYDQDVMTGANLINDESTTNVAIFYHDFANSYAANSTLGYFPMAWDFDENENLVELLIATNNFVPEYSEDTNGIFNEVNLQAAIHIWHGLYFYLIPWELNFLNKKDLTAFNIEEDTYLITEKLRDGEGNLIAFKMEPQTPFGFIIDYNIEYENRTL